MRDQLLDPQCSSFVFVLTAEHLPIQETRRAVSELAEHGLQVSALAINKLLPQEAGESEFLAQRRASQEQHLARIEHHLAALPRSYISLQGEDIQSLQALRQIAAQWRGDT
jgi:arsenite-transporting ATPase